MRTFNDRDGREWRLQIGTFTADRIKAATNGRVDFVEQGRGTGHNIFSVLANDLQLFGQVLWLMVERQAEEAGISESEFADAFDMDALERAQSALIEATIDFFPFRSRGLYTEAKTIAERVAAEQEIATIERAREILHSQEMKDVMIAAIRGN